MYELEEGPQVPRSQTFCKSLMQQLNQLTWTRPYTSSFAPGDETMKDLQATDA